MTDETYRQKSAFEVVTEECVQKKSPRDLLSSVHIFQDYPNADAFLDAVLGPGAAFLGRRFAKSFERDKASAYLKKVGLPQSCSGILSL